MSLPAFDLRAVVVDHHRNEYAIDLTDDSAAPILHDLRTGQLDNISWICATGFRRFEIADVAEFRVEARPSTARTEVAP